MYGLSLGLTSLPRGRGSGTYLGDEAGGDGGAGVTQHEATELFEVAVQLQADGVAEAEVDNRRAATCQTPEGTPPQVSALSERRYSSRQTGWPRLRSTTAVLPRVRHLKVHHLECQH